MVAKDWLWEFVWSGLEGELENGLSMGLAKWCLLYLRIVPLAKMGKAFQGSLICFFHVVLVVSLLLWKWLVFFWCRECAF